MMGDGDKIGVGCSTSLKPSQCVRLPIAGVDVEFPFQPYSVQKYMMSQILTAINKTQNCLLESPTGTGKTLALLCSSLAWQEKEQRVLSELREEMKKASTSASATASASATQNEKKGGKVVEVKTSESKTSGNSEGDYGRTMIIVSSDSSDEDIFQPPKRKKSSNSSSNFLDDCKTIKEQQKTVDGESIIEKESFKLSIDEKDKMVEPSNQSKENEASGATFDEEVKKFTPPTVYYGTRTHKQIAQVVHQLKKTSYARYVRMTILAAREHTCVNPSVKNKTHITEHCKHLLDPASGIGCSYYQGASKLQAHSCVQDMGLPVVFDIEDIVVMGTKRKICPYFTLRNISKTSNIVFCPYNYLIHPEMRASMNINLNKSIVIMDEAHNIEDICRETASLWLKADDITAAIKECRDHQERHINEFEYKAIESYLVKLEDFITSEGPVQSYSNNNESKLAWPGQNLIDRLHVAGVTKDGFSNLLDQMALIEKAKSEDPESNAAMSGVVRKICIDIKCCFKYLYLESNETKFQGFFHREIGVKIDADAVTWYSKHRRGFGEDSSGNREWKFALRILCLDPALVFKELETARTIILASGTLSPLESFKTELAVDFRYIVKGKHVVPPKNLYVSTISNGPSGVLLRGVYENINTYEYQDELGRVIMETSKIVPHGVLCFFPSYSLMDKLRDRWESNGLLEELSKVKEIYWEPRNKNEMSHVMNDFTLTINESRVDRSSIGAIMFGVYRGKIAEGIDFSDDNARVVLAVGIPFTNRNNFDVNLKIRFNDHRCLTNKSVLNGIKWYSTQAYRALNQALGRCIRHQNDWGAIILVDARFAQREVQENLPIWIRSETRTFQSWRKYTSEIQEFCNSMKENLQHEDVNPSCHEDVIQLD